MPEKLVALVFEIYRYLLNISSLIYKTIFIVENETQDPLQIKNSTDFTIDWSKY